MLEEALKIFHLEKVCTLQELDNNYYVTDSRDYQICIYTNER